MITSVNAPSRFVRRASRAAILVSRVSACVSPRTPLRCDLCREFGRQMNALLFVSASLYISKRAASAGHALCVASGAATLNYLRFHTQTSYCCDMSDNSECRQACKDALENVAASSEQEAVDMIAAKCGRPTLEVRKPIGCDAKSTFHHFARICVGDRIQYGSAFCAPRNRTMSPEGRSNRTTPKDNIITAGITRTRMAKVARRWMS